MTKKILKDFRRLGRQEDVDDPIVVCRFFTPFNRWSWYPISFDEEAEVFFGLVDGIEVEWGSFALEDLEACRDHRELLIDRDKYFKQAPISVIQRQIKGRCMML
ncbi:DUF2958 domain-containing protein [Sulfidibacter corallicola]|uniref:DUF2958 domain-containing protein n=1 Tax=Sulfidibacter corallicola TaxID=2818388 RepID=A0A8A4TL82_SULCO|nr:DUF2958 domain-containing protein [Sulfidibacter corallicola]QTD50716.1 DUF2958 domain-containing protein [Sulfidibacter corallicola]